MAQDEQGAAYWVFEPRTRRFMDGGRTMGQVETTAMVTSASRNGACPNQSRQWIVALRLLLKNVDSHGAFGGSGQATVRALMTTRYRLQITARAKQEAGVAGERHSGAYGDDYERRRTGHCKDRWFCEYISKTAGLRGSIRFHCEAMTACQWR